MSDRASDAVGRDRNADRAHELGRDLTAAADEIARLREWEQAWRREAADKLCTCGPSMETDPAEHADYCPYYETVVDVDRASRHALEGEGDGDE